MFSTNNQNINTFQPRTICSIDDFCRKTPAHSPIQRTAEVFVKILLLLRQMDNVKKYGLKEQVALLPLSPGVYQFLDKNGTIIYVGKAKSLRKRVSSYFMQNKEHSAKVQVLVRQIAAIRHIVVDTETDALLLENSLIKTLQPRYNILLKDDKTYPWIVVRREPFPRVQSTRILNRNGSQYFGPYGSVMMQRSILEFIREVIPLRTCSLNLSPAAIAKGRYSVCLQYHLGNCKGPCVGAQSEEEYDALVDMTVSILKGDLRPVRTYLEKEMEAAARNLKFEVAQRYKTRLDALDNYSSKSVIVSARIVDVDVFSLLVDDDVAYCNFLRIRHGSVVGVYTIRLTTGIDTDPAQMLTLAIQHIAETIAGTLAKEVIVPYLPSAAQLFDGVTFTVPKRGEKLDLLEFSLKSARIYRAEQLKNLEIKNPERHTERLMATMQKELHLDRPPGRQAFTQGVPPFQHQNRHRCRRLRLDARDRLPPLQPPDRRRSRTARPDYRGRRQRTALQRLCRAVRTGNRKTSPHRRPGQADRRDLLPRGPDALLLEPYG